MLGFGSHQQYYLYKTSVDMRKGYYGLSGIVRNEFGSDPMCKYMGLFSDEDTV